MEEPEPTHVLPKGIQLAELARRKRELDLPRILGDTPALLFRPLGEGEASLYMTPSEGTELGGGYPSADETSVLHAGEAPLGGSLEQAVIVVLTPTSRNLLEDQVVVGRGLENDIRLISPQVSKVHARFIDEDGEWKLQDEGSSNGTRINGVRLEPNRPYGLRPGDEIVLGDVVVLYLDAEGLLALTRLVTPAQEID
ncbi:MAG: FHA domain-containing protein [Planctomycetota bacterium]